MQRDRRPVRVIARSLFSWNEEISEKWASHDSMRQAEEVLAALAQAGYEVRLIDGSRPWLPTETAVDADTFEELLNDG